MGDAQPLGGQPHGPQMSTILMAFFLVKLAAVAVLLWNQGADTTRLADATLLAFTFALLPYGIVWSYSGHLSKLKAGIVAFSATMMQDLVRALPEAVQPRTLSYAEEVQPHANDGRVPHFQSNDVKEMTLAFLRSFVTAAGPAFSLQVTALLEAPTAKLFPPEAAPFIQAAQAALVNILVSQLGETFYFRPSLRQPNKLKALFLDPQYRIEMAQILGQIARTD